MNLFVLGWSGDGEVDLRAGGRALERVVERLPFFERGGVETWSAPDGRVAAAWVAHPPEEVGGVRYVHRDDRRIALFSGRPILWTGEFEADGRAPIDPAFYLRPADEWAESLDGRCVAARYDADSSTLELFTDRMGAYPLFSAEARSTRWFSNNAEVLRDLHGGTEIDPLALAGVLGGGWSLTGDPIWARVRRVEPGVVRTLGPGREERRRDLGGTDRVAELFGAGFDPSAAARTVVAGIRALADWPGRPNVVPVTGGRDSRLVLAAGCAAEIQFEAVTAGLPDHPDVRVGHRLAEAANRQHRIWNPPSRGGDVLGDPHGAARILALLSSGTASLADAAGYPLGSRPAPLVLWHSGQGGELARSHYGLGPRAPALQRTRLARLLYRRFVARRPGRRELIGRDARHILLGHLERWTGDQLGAGVAPVDVPDAFYLLKRMGTWAGAGHGCVEPVQDTTSVLWSHRLLPHQLGLPARERALETFHLRLMEVLAPELAGVPFSDGGTWRALEPWRRRRADRLRYVTERGAAELRGRLARRPPVTDTPTPGPAAPPPDRFGAVMAATRERLFSVDDQPLWEVLDRGRTGRLLASDAASLDEVRRWYVWRIATLVLDDAFEGVFA